MRAYSESIRVEQENIFLFSIYIEYGRIYFV